MPERLDAVLSAIDFVFNEGYAASRGALLVRVDLTAEAIRRSGGGSGDLDQILSRGELGKYLPAHSAVGELLRRAGKTSDALTAFQQALELARQEPEMRFLAARVKELTG
jgi:predicted RNA polymerase sigma factor